MNTGHLVEEALTYIDEVKKAFADRPDVYREFLFIIRNFKAERLSHEELQDNINKLFENSQTLRDGFDKFFPKDETVSVAAMREHSPFHQAHAMQYVVKVRNRYLNRPEVYSAFLTILSSFNSPSMSHSYILSEIASLFRGHGDLLLEFTCFLPINEQQQAREYMQHAIMHSGPSLKEAAQDTGEGNAAFMNATRAASDQAGVSAHGAACVTPAKRPRASSDANVEHSYLNTSFTPAEEEGLGANCGVDNIVSLPSPFQRKSARQASSKGHGKTGITGANSPTLFVPFPGADLPGADLPVPGGGTSSNNKSGSSSRNRSAPQTPRDTKPIEELALTEKEAVAAVVTTEQERRLSALECRVEWQHKRIHDLACQVTALQEQQQQVQQRQDEAAATERCLHYAGAVPYV